MLEFESDSTISFSSLEGFRRGQEVQEKEKGRKARSEGGNEEARREEGQEGREEVGEEGCEEGRQEGCEEGREESCRRRPSESLAKSKAPTAEVSAEAAQQSPSPSKKPVAAADEGPRPSRDNIFYITTAIAYPNGQPHIGHAYEAIATDALARFARLDGKDVFFLTGTDEHGLKMVQTAEAEGLTVEDLAARNAGRFKAMDERLNVSFDRYIRTTEAQHHRSSQAIWNRMQQNGDIYIDTYAGWYSVRDEAYYAEDETTVGEDNVRRGGQGTPVEWVEEKTYFFKLSAYQDRLLALYESQPDFIGPDARRNEVTSFVKRGLKDLSISRTTFDWGVKVPNDPEARDVCLGRRAHQLHHRRRLPRRDRQELALLAGRSAHHRQGHHPLPRGVLAGVPDVGGHSRARSGSTPTASCSTRARRCRSRSAMSSTPSISPTSTASTRSATSSCARSRSARTATTTTRPSWRASMPISPTISAIWRSARCR